LKKYQLKNKSPIKTRQYIEKADHFLQGMKLLSDDVPSYRSGVGLLAIHSAISLNDAITVGLTGKRKIYQDHTHAARELGRVCSSAGVPDRKGVGHFKWLLGQKNAVAYEHREFDDKSVRLAVEKAERFNVWAYDQFKEILRGV
jgi:hypothetical protein